MHKLSKTLKTYDLVFQFRITNRIGRDKMKSSVRTGLRGNTRIITMDNEIDQLRKEIWKTIFAHRKDLSDCDVAMALCLVQYELIHHTKG